MNPSLETLHQTPAVTVISEMLTDFKSISLNEMDRVLFLTRFDSKYFINTDLLQQILEAVKDDYFVLETAGKRIQSYETIYFDTSNDRFYLEHHNGRSTRMKLRKREYSDSGIVFLEIKKKNNKGQISKKRMEISGLGSDLSPEEIAFVKKNTNLNGDKLEAKFESTFKRITLVSKNFDERCTIDLDLRFNSYSAEKSDLKGLVIAELKQDRQFLRSKMAAILKEHKLQKISFSKYCFGRAINEGDLKSNVFKPGIRQIKNQLK